MRPSGTDSLSVVCCGLSSLAPSVHTFRYRSAVRFRENRCGPPPYASYCRWFAG